MSWSSTMSKWHLTQGHFNSSRIYLILVFCFEDFFFAFYYFSSAGPRSLVKDLSLWDAPLSDGDVTSLYSKGLGRDTEKNGHDKVRKESASVVAVEQALSLLIQARSSLIAVPSPSLLQNGDIGLSFPPEESSEAEFDRLFSDIASGLVGINGEAERKDRLSLAAALMQRWKEEDEKSQGQAEASCSEGAFFRRLDIFAEAAALGSGEALYFWAIQRIYGHLQPQSACGARASRAGRGRRATAKEEDANTLALLYALDMGEPRAMVPLAVRLLTGRGMSWMFGYTEGCGDGSKDRTEEVAEQWLVPKSYGIPLPRDYYVANSSAYFRPSRIQHGLVRAVRSTCSGGHSLSRTVGASSMDRHYSQWPLQASGTCNARHLSALVDHTAAATATDIALGLLHIAAMFSDPEASAILSKKYEHGLGGLEKDPETAAQYAAIAAEGTTNLLSCKHSSYGVFNQLRLFLSTVSEGSLWQNQTALATTPPGRWTRATRAIRFRSQLHESNFLNLCG